MTGVQTCALPISRQQNDERHARGFLEQTPLLPLPAVLAEQPAVVAEEDDDGAVGELEAVERGDAALEEHA